MWCLAALLLLGRAGAVAQPPTGQWWILHQETAKPSQLALYEQTAKDFKAIVEANRAAMPTFFYTVLQGEDMTYTYAAPIKNFAGMDVINGEFGAMAQAAGAKFGELMQRGAPAIDHFAEFVVGEEPELGYKPATPRLKMDDAAYYRYTMYYVMPGKEEEAKAVAKDYSALFKSKGAGNGYNLYWALTGPDLPLLVVEQWAKDEADWAATDAAVRAAVGDAIKPLDQRALALTRRIETKTAWLRPDLSTRPTAPVKK
jgi:hypothetical protein